jgi:hypothetical protein
MPLPAPFIRPHLQEQAASAAMSTASISGAAYTNFTSFMVVPPFYKIDLFEKLSFPNKPYYDSEHVHTF